MTYSQFYNKFPKVKSDVNRTISKDYMYTDENIPDYEDIKYTWSDFDPKRYIPLGFQDQYENSYILYDTKNKEYINVWGDTGEPEITKDLNSYKEFYSN